MTIQQYNKFKADHSHLSNGALLGFLIRGILENLDLTLIQSGTVEEIKGGSFNPKDKVMYKSVLEILELASSDKVDTLITNLKRLPSLNEGGDSIVYLLNGSECSKGIYYSADRDFVDRGLIGKQKRTIKNAPRMSEEVFSQFLEDYEKRWGRVVKKVSHHPIPEAKEKAPATEPVYRDLGEDDEAWLDEEQEMHHVEPSEPWVNRPKEDDDADNYNR